MVSRMTLPLRTQKKKVLPSENLLCAYGDALLSVWTGQKYFHPI